MKDSRAMEYGYKLCSLITKEECVNCGFCHTCSRMVDTSDNGWREGEYYCSKIRTEYPNAEIEMQKEKEISHMLEMHMGTALRNTLLDIALE